MSLNTYTFTGRLGSDAELKFTQGGTPIWTARVAVDYGWGDNKGTSWINAKSLGKHAEALGKLDLQKGAAIGGTGELQVREYDKKDGGKGISVECLVNKIELLGPKPDSGNGTPRNNAPQPKRRDEPAMQSMDDFGDETIPFISCRGTF